MKIGLIADPHFSNRKGFAYETTVRGVNTRLKYVADAFCWATHQMRERDISTLVVLGDLTHDHGVLTPPVYEVIQQCLQTPSMQKMTTYMISGNHDLHSSGQSILPVFNDQNICMFPDSPVLENLGGVDCAFIPYGVMHSGDSGFALPEADFIFCHAHFEGAVHGSHEFQPSGGWSEQDIPRGVRRVISGHYHKAHSPSKRVIYSGALLQHDFGEATYTPGFGILDLGTGKIEQVELPPHVAPRFHILSWDADPELIPGDPKWDYYRIDLPAEVDLSAIKELRDSLDAVKVRSMPPKAMRSWMERMEKDDDSIFLPVESTEDVFPTVDEVIAIYAEQNSETQDRAQRLIDVGLRLANTVRSTT